MMVDIGLLIFFDKTLYNHCTNFGCSRPHPNGMERIPMASPRRPTTPETWFRDRITELRRVPSASLVPHPHNWRRHGPDQQSAMHGLLAQLGYVNALIVREAGDGTYQVLDGHMRLELSEGATEVPVLVVDVSDEEADLVLATHDPIGDLALPDAELSDALA